MSNQDPRRTISERLQEAGLDSAGRYINVPDGEKGARIKHSDPNNRQASPPSGNYGVYADGRDELVLVDVDDYEDLDDPSGLGALFELPNTLEVETAHGGSHHYFRVPMTDTGRLPAAVLEDEFGAANPTPSWGEVRVANQYVVGPGSQLDGCNKDGCDECDKPDGGVYEIVADSEIATLESETLVKVLGADPRLKDDETAPTPEGPPAPEPRNGEPSRDKKLEIALENDDKLRRLWNHRFEEYDGDRSRAESALAMKLGWWFGGSKSEVRWAMDRCDPPKWSKRPDDSYRRSVLSAVDRLSDTADWDGGRNSSLPSAATDGGVQAETPAQNGAGDAKAGAPDPETLGLSWDAIAERYRQASDADEKRPARYSAAELLCDRQHFRTLERSNTVYHYDHETGVYQDRGKRVVQRRLVDRLEEQYTAHEQNEIIEMIRGRTYTRDLGGPEGYICVGNGVLELESGELLDHDPDMEFLASTSVEYDPDADAELFREFLADVVPKSTDRKKLQEYVGYCLHHWGMPYHKALFIVGPQSSGKSTFLETVRSLLGDDTVSRLTPQEMTEERFSAADLYDKWANIRNDIPTALIENVGRFKEIIGGDPIKAERKYEDPFSFTPTVKHLYSANQLPDAAVDDAAFFRRILLVSFPSTVPRDARDPTLLDRLEDELPGVLNWALEGLERLHEEGGFTGDRGPAETEETWQMWGHPIDRFKNIALEEDSKASVAKDRCYKAFVQYCEDEGMPAETKTKLTQELTTSGDIGQARRTVDGRRKRVYTGIRLKDGYKPGQENADKSKGLRDY